CHRGRARGRQRQNRSRARSRNKARQESAERRARSKVLYSATSRSLLSWRLELLARYPFFFCARRHSPSGFRISYLGQQRQTTRNISESNFAAVWLTFSALAKINL